MLLVYVGSGEDLISQKCEHINKVSEAHTTLERLVFYVTNQFCSAASTSLEILLSHECQAFGAGNCSVH